jgi:hypothetical protein
VNDERTGKCLRQVEHICGHLWHRYFITVTKSWYRLYDNRDYFSFPIVNFPFICSNIPTAPGYGVYLFQMIRYSRACGSYQDSMERRLLLTRKLLNQRFLLVKLKSSLRKLCGRYHDFVTVMKYLCHKWPQICSTCRKHFQHWNKQILFLSKSRNLLRLLQTPIYCCTLLHVIVRRIWRYQRGNQKRISKNRQHNGQKKVFVDVLLF